MFSFSRLFGDPLKGSCDLYAKGHDQQNRAAASEQGALEAVNAAHKHLQTFYQSGGRQCDSPVDAHAAYIQALLNLLSLQLQQTQKAVAMAQPDSKSCGAVTDTRAKLEDALTAAWQLIDWRNTRRGAAGITAGSSFMDLLEQPSILGAMQFCRYFTSNAGLALLHKATGADKQQQHGMPCNTSSYNTQSQQDSSNQQQALKPFTLVVDAKGTGHVATLQAALDMAAVAAGQRAQQHYSSSTSSDMHMPSQATCSSSSSSTSACNHSSSHEQQSVAAGYSKASDADVQASSSCSSSTRDSAAACDNMLIVLLPGTYAGSYALPGSIRHITIAGIPGGKTLLCEAGANQHSTDTTASSSSSTGSLQGRQQQQHALQELDARMLRMQLAQRQEAPALPGQLLRSSFASTAQQHRQQGTAAACLLTCPFGVESLKLQHLHMELAGATGKHGAAQFQRVLMCQESAPASIRAVRAAGVSSSSSSRLSGSSSSSRLSGSSSSSRLSGSSSIGGKDSGSKGGEASVVGEGASEPYCIRICSGSELRMEWCEFSGGAGGVLSEAGAMVAAMQCSFHQ